MKLERIYARLGAKVAMLRIARRLTQQQVADYMDLTRCSIANIEGGKQRILLHQVVPLAEVLCVRPSSLLKDIL